jgi:hypothetical protein
MTNSSRPSLCHPRRYAGWLGIACLVFLVYPTTTNSQLPQVTKQELDAQWQGAVEAFERQDCVGFLDAASRYYGLIKYASFSWDTYEIGRAYDYCLRTLYSALQDRDRLLAENAMLRSQLVAAEGGTASKSSGLRRPDVPPPLRRRPPHDLP